MSTAQRCGGIHVELWYTYINMHDQASGCVSHVESSWGQHGAHLGLVGPRRAPCWPYEACYRVCYLLVFAHTLKTRVKWVPFLIPFEQHFLAATKQLYKWYFPSVCPSVRLSVRLSHLFDYVPIIGSSWNFQELLLMTKVRSMQKVKVRGQRSRSQRSQPNLTVSGL